MSGRIAAKFVAKVQPAERSSLGPTNTISRDDFNSDHSSRIVSAFNSVATLAAAPHRGSGEFSTFKLSDERHVEDGSVCATPGSVGGADEKLHGLAEAQAIQVELIRAEFEKLLNERSIGVVSSRIAEAEQPRSESPLPLYATRRVSSPSSEMQSHRNLLIHLRKLLRDATTNIQFAKSLPTAEFESSSQHLSQGGRLYELMQELRQAQEGLKEETSKKNRLTSEVEKLEAKTAEMRAEISHLMAQLEATRTQRTQLSSELQSHRLQINDLTDALGRERSIKVKVEGQVERIAQLQVELKALKNTLIEEQRTKQQMVTELEKFRKLETIEAKRVTELSAELVGLKSAMATAQLEKSQLATDLLRANERVEALESQLIEASALHQQVLEELARVGSEQSRSLEYEQRLAGLSDAFATAQEENKKLTDEISRLRDVQSVRTCELSREVRQLTDALKEEQMQKLRLQEEMSRHRDGESLRYEELTREVERLCSSLQEEQSQKSQLAEELTQIREEAIRVAEASQETRVLREQLSKEQLQRANLADELRRLQAVHDAEIATTIRLHEELRRVQQEFANEQDLRSELAERVHFLELRKGSHGDLSAELRAENELLWGRLEEARAKEAQLVEGLNQLKLEMAELRQTEAGKILAELEMTRQQLEEAKQQLEALRWNDEVASEEGTRLLIESMNAQIDALMKDVAAAKSERTTTEASLKATVKQLREESEKRSLAEQIAEEKERSLQELLQGKEQSLQEKERLSEEKERSLQQLLQEKERSLQEKERLAEEKERSLQKLLQEKDRSLQERERLSEEKERSLQKLLHEKEQSLQEKERLSEEKERSLQELLQEKQEAVQEKERLSEEKERSWQELLQEKERSLQEKERLSEEKERSLQELLHEKERSLQEKERLYDDCSAELEELRSKLMDLEQANHATAASSRPDVEINRVAHDDGSKELVEAKAKLEAVESELRDTLAQKVKAEEEVVALRMELATTRSPRKGQKQRQADNSVMTEPLEEKIRLLTADNCKPESEWSSTSKDFAALQLRAIELEKELIATQTELQSLKETAEAVHRSTDQQTQTTVATLEERLAAALATIEVTEKELEVAKSQVDGLASTIEARNDEQGRLRESLQQQAQEVISLREEITSKDSQRVAWEELVEGLKKDSENLLRGNEKTTKELLEKAAEIDVLRHDLETVRARLRETESILEQKQQCLDTLQAEGQASAVQTESEGLERQNSIPEAKSAENQGPFDQHIRITELEEQISQMEAELAKHVKVADALAERELLLSQREAEIVAEIKDSDCPTGQETTSKTSTNATTADDCKELLAQIADLEKERDAFGMRAQELAEVLEAAETRLRALEEEKERGEARLIELELMQKERDAALEEKKAVLQACDDLKNRIVELEARLEKNSQRSNPQCSSATASTVDTAESEPGEAEFLKLRLKETQLTFVAELQKLRDAVIPNFHPKMSPRNLPFSQRTFLARVQELLAGNFESISISALPIEKTLSAKDLHVEVCRLEALVHSLREQLGTVQLDYEKSKEQLAKVEAGWKEEYRFYVARQQRLEADLEAAHGRANTLQRQLETETAKRTEAEKQTGSRSKGVEKVTTKSDQVQKIAAELKKAEKVIADLEAKLATSEKENQEALELTSMLRDQLNTFAPRPEVVAESRFYLGVICVLIGLVLGVVFI